MATDTEIIELITGASEVYEAKVNASQLDVYCEDLRKYTIDQLRTAYRAHRQDPERGRWMPRSGDIIHAINQMPKTSPPQPKRKQVPVQTDYDKARDIAILLYKRRITQGLALRDGTPLEASGPVKCTGDLPLVEAVAKMPIPTTDRRSDHAEHWELLYEVFDQLWNQYTTTAA